MAYLRMVKCLLIDAAPQLQPPLQRKAKINVALHGKNNWIDASRLHDQIINNSNDYHAKKTVHCCCLDLVLPSWQLNESLRASDAKEQPHVRERDTYSGSLLDKLLEPQVDISLALLQSSAAKSPITSRAHKR